MKAVTDYKFDRIIRLIGMAGIALVFCSFLYQFFTSYFPLPYLTAVLLSFAFFFIGFGLQCLSAKLFGFERTKSDGSYENMEGFFHKNEAVPAILASLVPAIVAAIATGVYVSSRGDYYTNSFLPFLIAILGFAISVSGVVVWFYPPERLSDRRALTVCLLIDFAIYMISVFLLQKYISLLALIMNPADTLLEMQRGASLNLFTLILTILTFLILFVTQKVNEKHYKKLNALMAEYKNENLS